MLLMTIIIAAMQDSLLSIESSKTGWRTYESLKGTNPQCIAFDFRSPSRVYCGTFDDGLWKTNDGGQTWIRIGRADISSNAVMSISVSSLEACVYVGTEPSALYRSDDGGESWRRLSGLNNLKSSTFWSFPPRPSTSHIRWIESDANKPGYVFVAIEAGALVQSRDGGKTWIDKVEGGPYDSHTLATHQKAPKRLYSAAGDGYFESLDYGSSWKTPAVGLKHHYVYGLAVNPSDPQNVIVSASQSPWRAHSIEGAHSLIYRKSRENNGEWKVISDGLPEPSGTIISMLAANPNAAEEFYAINNRGLFFSTNSGISWSMLDISWPKEYLSQHPWAIAVARGNE
jgi:photosynthesis system II assembly factor YCF48-like protein